MTEFNTYNNELQKDPLTFQEAIRRSDRRKWEEAMKYEIETLELRNTWEKVYPPRGANVIGTRFV